MFDPITSEILSSLCWAYIEDTNHDEAKRQEAGGPWVGGVGGVGGVGFAGVFHNFSLFFGCM